MCCDNDDDDDEDEEDDDDAVDKHAATEVHTINSSVSQIVVDLVVANFVQDCAINVDVTILNNEFSSPSLFLAVLLSYAMNFFSLTSFLTSFC